MKKLLTIGLMLLACVATAQVPPFQRQLFTTNANPASTVNANQFSVSGAKLSIKDGALTTNLVLRGSIDGQPTFINGITVDGTLQVNSSLTLSDGTASTIQRLNAGKQLSEVTIGDGVVFDGTTLSLATGLTGSRTNTGHYRFIPSIGATIPALTITDSNGNALSWVGTQSGGGFVWRLGTNANTFTSISNNPTTTNTSIASGGNAPSIYIGPAGAISYAGNQTFVTDNTFDIGASGATRPRTLYVGTSIVVPDITASATVRAGATSLLGVESRLAIKASSDGVALIQNWAQSDINRLQFGGTTAAFPGLGKTNGDLIVFGADGAFAGGSTNRLLIYGGLVVGKPGTAGTLTNTLYASATLDFPSTAAGGVSDLPITLAAASDGDIVALGVPSAQLTGLTGDYFAWASNGVVYVRFANNNLLSAQDPSSGTFRVRVDKFQ